MNSTIKAVKSGSLYPRAIVEILHKIIYEGKTWAECHTSPDEIEQVFGEAWLVYNKKTTNNELCTFCKWVMSDMETLIARAIMTCSHNVVVQSKTVTSGNVVIPFRVAA